MLRIKLDQWAKLAERFGLAHPAAKAELSEKLVIDTARETVERFRAVWDAEKKPAADMIDTHAPTVELYRVSTK